MMPSPTGRKYLGAPRNSAGGSDAGGVGLLSSFMPYKEAEGSWVDIMLSAFWLVELGDWAVLLDFGVQEGLGVVGQESGEAHNNPEREKRIIVK